jgi:hypothetical protein
LTQTHVAGEAAPADRGLDRLTLAIGLGVLLLVAIGIAVAIFTGRGQAPLDLSTPEGVTLAYETDIQRGEADAAWDLLTSEAQAGTTRQEFLARASGFGRGGDVRFSVENVRSDGTTAHLDLVRTESTRGFLGLGAGSFSNRSPVTLVRENGQWRISVPANPYVIMQPAGAHP